MPIRYFHSDAKKRRHSIIENNGNAFTFIERPQAGCTADTRFFGTPSNQKTFVVKQPKYTPFTKDKRTVDITHTTGYKKEKYIWNLVYPTKKAYLVTTGGPRLILPYLPGGTLRENLSDDPLICCQQLLAVAYAVQEFHKLGWNYSDFNQDNVLIEQTSDGTFKAYLIDFDAIFWIKKLKTNQEISCLNSLSHRVPNLRCNEYGSLETLIDGLSTEIIRLRKVSQGASSENTFNSV